ncbi:MAG: DUF3786 domain-containing protein [Bacillota bacterium]
MISRAGHNNTPSEALAIDNHKRSFFNLDVTYNRAAEALAKLDPLQVAARAQVSFNKQEAVFRLPFINRPYHVTFPQGRVKDQDGNEVSLYLAIIALHYLVTADGASLEGRWVSFRHLPGGDIYMDPFQRRAVTPFLKTFADRPEAFSRAATALGGYQAGTGGVSAVIPVMPCVPLCFVLWPGDEEMPASANILFDARASSYLPTEDYAHLPAIVNGEMKKIIE